MVQTVPLQICTTPLLNTFPFYLAYKHHTHSNVSTRLPALEVPYQTCCVYALFYRELKFFMLGQLLIWVIAYSDFSLLLVRVNLYSVFPKDTVLPTKFHLPLYILFVRFMHLAYWHSRSCTFVLTFYHANILSHLTPQRLTFRAILRPHFSLVRRHLPFLPGYRPVILHIRFLFGPVLFSQLRFCVRVLSITS